MFSKKYEILEHPADLKIRSYGKKMDEIFSNMIEGMFKSCRPEMTKEKVSREIKIESLDRESLLVNFLSEALTLSDINEEVYLKVKFDNSIANSDRIMMRKEIVPLMKEVMVPDD